MESFNGKLRDELINQEIFTMLVCAKVLIKRRQKAYNEVKADIPVGRFSTRLTNKETLRNFARIQIQNAGLRKG